MFITSLLFLLSGWNAVTAVVYDERNCNESWVPLPTTVNTTERLQALRTQMQDYNISGYIITSNDDHQSEYVADHDKRISYISGFTGSVSIAVVTFDAAALWVDSRYYIQAADQLDCNWLIMPTGETSTPDQVSWLNSQLTTGSVVSADSKTSPFTEWEQWRVDLEKDNLTLFVTTENLVDQIWTKEGGRPDYPNKPIIVLDIKYAGLSWQDKIQLLLNDIKAQQADTLVLSALDEIAWTLNLRGGDIPFTPVFRSYLVIQENNSTLYLPEELMSEVVENHLNSNGQRNGTSVIVKEYTEIWADLERIGEERTRIALPKAYSYASGVSYLLHSMVWKSLAGQTIKCFLNKALLRKDTKNEVEAEGMRAAHIRDAVALSVFLARLEESIKAGESVTELQAVAQLDALRWEQPESYGPSFDTIAAVGINAALPHYEPSNATNTNITDQEVFEVDSGGQYSDGTTDVTRTVHFGTPREIEVTVYTNLLMGCIDIVTTTFPKGYGTSNLEVLIRRPLYALGLDYGHGSTHGIGSFLNVHEAFNSTLRVGFFGSQEPGYYKEDDFGMRLENIVTVVPANPPSGADNYLTFETVTVAPYDPKLINVTLLEKRHVRWINEYNLKIRNLVGEEMLRQGYNGTEYQWLLDKTQPLEITQ